MHTTRGDGVTGIKRRRRNLSGDGVRKMTTASGRGRLKRGSRIIYVVTASGLQSDAVAAIFLNGKIVDSLANQHLTYTDKELDNVLDISHLRIKVGHPNRTKAYISKIENLRLSNGLTLYDVMVILEYCVTLNSVYKLVKENKVIVAFDENRCYFLNQDLNLKNVVGIGDHYEGFMIGHPAEPVLNVLKNSLQIDKKDNIGCCEICQKAKQTREPFPLSDHTSKCLGDLVHLDL
ncbi:hypothetical protein Tco_0879699 [Tanacetum coccineum]